MTIKDFVVGQTAYIYNSYRREQTVKEVTVKKIGRIYVTVSGPWEEKFSVPDYGERDFLLEKSDYGRTRKLFRSKQDIEDYIEKYRLFSELHDAFSYGRESYFTLEQLRSVKRIVAGEPAVMADQVEE